MATAVDREIRRHLLRFVHDARDGEEFSRVVHQQLITYGHRITWQEFDRHLTYLERAGCVQGRFLRPAVDRSRQLKITQKGIDVLEGSVQEPGVMPPDEI